MFKFEQNAVVKDKVTGYRGVILGRTEYATGCIQYGVCQQNLLPDGKFPEWHWFDESRLEVLKENALPGLRKQGGQPESIAPTQN